jgi:hypothetical protein
MLVKYEMSYNEFLISKRSHLNMQTIIILEENVRLNRFRTDALHFFSVERRTLMTVCIKIL